MILITHQNFVSTYLYYLSMYYFKAVFRHSITFPQMLLAKETAALRDRN